MTQISAPILTEFQSSMSSRLAGVDVMIRQHLASDVALVNQVAKYIVGAGGKRLRPLMVLLSAEACAYQGDQHTLLAAVVELIHTATLLHDDVVDESDLRRGRDTANALFGNAASVLVGDFLYSRAFQMMVSVGKPRVQEILSDATNRIAEGEVLQLMHIGNAELTEAEYIHVIQYKTAKLFEASAQLGAVLAGASATVECALAAYGMHMGTAFQIIDDVLDYTGVPDEIGKQVGDDLSEGKLTLPVIYALDRCSPEQAAQLKVGVVAGDKAVLPQLLAAMAQTDAVERTRAVAEASVVAAKAALSELPESPALQLLYVLADLAVARRQ